MVKYYSFKWTQTINGSAVSCGLQRYYNYSEFPDVKAMEQQIKSKFATIGNAVITIEEFKEISKLQFDLID